MAQLLSPLIRQGWIKNDLDDVIIFAPNSETLLNRLNTLFQHLSKSDVKLNLSKCAIGMREVKFLGHIVSEASCRPDPENVKVVQNMKPSTNAKGVQSFLGMCGFYWKHIPCSAKIAAPLTNLTRKSAEFQWTDQYQEAFDELKSRLTQAPILVKADVHQLFTGTTDASGTHVGGVLSQMQADGTNWAIGYFSRKLKGPECRYSVTDKEALAVVLTCRHFHHFLWGTEFTIVTDHQPLVTIFKKKTKSPRMKRWILEMREYQYRTGKSRKEMRYLQRRRKMENTY